MSRSGNIMAGQCQDKEQDEFVTLSQRTCGGLKSSAG
jgi:hypothetical protein